VSRLFLPHAVLSCAPPSFYCEWLTSLAAVTKAGSNDEIYDVTCSHELIESLLWDILKYCSVASDSLTVNIGMHSMFGETLLVQFSAKNI